MRSYFLVSLTNRCNLSCGYCIVKEWRNNPSFPDRLSFEPLAAYLSKHARRGDLAEITGGEPTLVPWLEDLVVLLDGMGLDVVLRTNGARLFKNTYKNLVIAFNPHSQGEEFAAQRKKLLRRSDRAISLDITDSRTPSNKTGIHAPFRRHPFANARFVTADGNIRRMPCDEKSIGSIFSGETGSSTISPVCSKCPFMAGAWNMRWKTKLPSVHLMPLAWLLARVSEPVLAFIEAARLSQYIAWHNGRIGNEADAR